VTIWSIPMLYLLHPQPRHRLQR